MLYFYISDSSIEAVQTSGSIIGREKIIAYSRKEIPDGYVINGLIVDANKLMVEVQELLKTASPKAMIDSQVCVAVSDKQVFTQRFKLTSVDNQSDISKEVIEEVKKALPYNPSELENFYKVIELPGKEKSILYTATPKTTVVNFSHFFNAFNLTLGFLSSSSYSVYQIIKHAILADSTVLYCSVDKKMAEYYLYDQHGPILVSEKKFGAKTFSNETKSIIEKWASDQKLTVSKIILGGYGSLEIQTQEVSDITGISTEKISDLMDNILQKTKTDFSSGDIPKMLFVNSLGLYFLTKNSSSPNFAKDFKFLPSSTPSTTQVVSEKDHETIPDNTQVTKIDTSIEDTSFVEYKKSNILQFLTSKVFIFITSIIIGFAFFTGAFLLIRKNNSFTNFFQPTPSGTPVPTIAPTFTPTPTIDSKLKRSDLKILVQNGTDKTGYAKEIATFLENKGYKDIAKANADKDSYESTEIKIKEAKKNYLPLLKNDLKEKVDASTESNLDETSKFDVVVVLGKK